MEDFEEIYSKYQPEVYRFLLRLTSFDKLLAEELAQETFYQAFLSFGRFRGECSMRTWLFQITKNVHAKYLRKEKRQREITARTVSQDSPAPSENLEQQEMLSRLRALIAELNEPARTVMHYRLYTDAGYAEIGRILNMRANTAAVIYNRTVAKLRRAMKERYGYEI